MSEKTDIFYVKRAIALARKGRAQTAPNPMVGAVLVCKDQIVGEGYHRAPGTPHAEILALRAAGKRALGATLYTSLEPCCHTKKRTPPCTAAIIQSGVVQVVSAMKDPNPMVAGKGFECLQKAGIKVHQGLQHLEAERLNEAFIKHITSGKPFVTLKAAMTLDGRIATASGASKWISGEKARKEVDRLRADANGVLVGIGTVLADNPMLRLRKIKGTNPSRIVLDPYLKIPRQSKLVTTAKTTSTIILTTTKAKKEQIDLLKAVGVQVEVFDEAEGIIPFDAVLDYLGQIGINHLLIEGGGRVNGVALRSGLVDRVIFYLSPRFLCGDDAKSVVAGTAISKLDAAIELEELKVRRMGSDIRVEGRLKK